VRREHGGAKLVHRRRSERCDLLSRRVQPKEQGSLFYEREEPIKKAGGENDGPLTGFREKNKIKRKS